jgi:hypothetical protein
LGRRLAKRAQRSGVDRDRSLAECMGIEKASSDLAASRPSPSMIVQHVFDILEVFAEDDVLVFESLALPLEIAFL